MATEAAAGAEGPPDLYLIIHNVAKNANVGTMIRSAAAFGVKEVRALTALLLRSSLAL